MSQFRSNYQKIVLGLKIKQLRQEKGLSFGEFAERTGMSMSYLNEIEKGKKYPKEDKIDVLAKALGVENAVLTSASLSKNLAPLGELLNSNFLSELPLDLFGIDLQKVVELIAEAPSKVGAFISTLVELGRTYAVGEENFYFRALRAYQELHNNYFEEIEDAAENFIEKHKLKHPLSLDELTKIISIDFETQIVLDGLRAYPELQHFRSLALPQHQKLLLNGLLNHHQIVYQLAKEIGFKVLGLEARVIPGLRAQTFEEVLNNFKAAYFAVAILIPKDDFIRDIRQFFENEKWDALYFSHLMVKYAVSSETLFQRFNVLPRFFGIEKLFFMRFIHKIENDEFDIDKELHLFQRHQPHANGLFEHYCRRWKSISLIRDLNNANLSKNATLCDIQRQKYSEGQEEYLTFTLARPAYPSPNRNVSVTIGLQIDNHLRKTIKFIDHLDLHTTQVGVTCERCPIENCKERVAPPLRLEERERRKKIQQTLTDIAKS
ncbi:MAG: helix-turn-helix domain-containing protein [Saprospiraceae bacterium]